MQNGARGCGLGLLVVAAVLWGTAACAQGKRIAYLTPSLDVSFWGYVASGVQAGGKLAGDAVTVLDSKNDDAIQLQNAEDAITRGFDGLVLSPTTSTAAPAVLRLAEKAHVPVVICDIGTTEGTYTSFIASDNLHGARGIGLATAKLLSERGWTSGSFGIIGIPQARKNGRLRSEGFRSAMRNTGLNNEIPLREMKTFSMDESFQFTIDMLTGNPDLHVIFVEADDQAIAAAAAVWAAHRNSDIIIAAFDGTPELLTAIADGRIVGAGMQQPYLMGSTASKRLAEALAGGKPPKLEMIPVLTVTRANALEKMDQIRLNVFANHL